MKDAAQRFCWPTEDLADGGSNACWRIEKETAAEEITSGIYRAATARRGCSLRPPPFAIGAPSGLQIVRDDRFIQ